MIHCKNCNHNNIGDARFCESCGEKLKQNGDKKIRERLTSCRDCEHNISKQAELCPSCGVRLRKTKQQDISITKGITTKRDPGVAAALGLFFGPFGYLYLGRYGLCVIMFFSGIIIIALLGLWAAPVLWVLWAVNQYMIAKQINKELDE